MKYQAILFDVDGVLVESERSRFNFLRKSCQQKGILLSDNSFYKMIGKSTPVVIKEICSYQNSNNLEEELLKEFNVFRSTYIQSITPISTTVDFISQYAGNSKIGIATSNSKETVAKLLQYLKIHNLVDGVVTRDDVVNQKPNPEPYLKLAKLLNIEPSSCAVIEDTTIGATAGIDAGMDCYVFLNSYNKKEQFKELDIKGFVSTGVDLKAIALP
jgi:beta-phosphoglucomutase